MKKFFTFLILFFISVSNLNAFSWENEISSWIEEIIYTWAVLQEEIMNEWAEKEYTDTKWETWSWELVDNMISEVLWEIEENINTWTIDNIETNVSPIKYTYYYWETCSYCRELNNFLERNNLLNKLDITKKEVWKNKSNASEMVKDFEKLWITNSSSVWVPFIVMEQDWKLSYITGLDNALKHFTPLIDKNNWNTWIENANTEIEKQEVNSWVIDNKTNWNKNTISKEHMFYAIFILIILTAISISIAMKKEKEISIQNKK